MLNTPPYSVPDGKECCGDNFVSPAKTRRYGNDAASKFTREFDNPIPKELDDPDYVKKFFKRFPFVPYAGTRDNPKQSFLNLLLDLSDVSPTLSGCIDQIGRFCFNSGMYLVDQEENLFIADSVNLSSNKTQLRYSEFVKNISLGRLNFGQFVHSIYRNLKNGNVWVEYQEIETAGVKNVRFIIHDPRTCLYWLEPNAGDVEYVGISKRFDEAWLIEHPPKIIPKYPYKLDDDDGVTKSMFHFTEEEHGFYGRPDWISAFIYAYREYQDALFQVKMAANNFTGQVIIEVEDDPPSTDNNFGEQEAHEAGFTSTQDRMEFNFSNKSPDPSTMMFLTRPYGARPVTVEEIQPNTNENFYKVSDEITEKKILIANQWSKKLLTGDVATGLSSTSFLDELKTKEKSVIAYYQNSVENVLQELFAPAMEFLGFEDIMSAKLRFNLPYSDDEESTDELPKSNEL